MDIFVSWIMVIGALVVLAIIFGPQLLTGVYWFFAMLAQGAVFFFDNLFSAALVPGIPWLMWVVWGMLIGAALGFWTLAPIYGLRQYRVAILCAPLGLMLLVMGVRLMAGG